MRYLFIWLFGFLSANPLCGQLFGPQLPAMMLTGPEKALPDIRTLAVVGFEAQDTKEAVVVEGKVFTREEKNDSGKKLADFLTASILKDEKPESEDIFGRIITSYLTGAHTKLFKVVEKDELDKILQEQKFALSGLVDESQAAEVGALLGADAIILGSVSHTSKDEKKKKEYEEEGNTKYSYCTTRKVTAFATMRIVSVSTREILTNIEKQAIKKDKKCDANRSKLATEEVLLTQALNQLGEALATHICPRFRLVNYPIKKIKTKAHKSKSREAVNYIKRREFSKAFAIYAAIQEEDPYNEQAAYNLGILYEVVGNHAKATEKYAVAREINESDRTYRMAQKRMEKAATQVKIWQDIGINIIPGDYAQVEGKKANALAGKIRTKGSKKDRYEVYEEASNKSNVLLKVPGGTNFTVIEESDNWVLVKLLGGKQGYISKQNIR